MEYCLAIDIGASSGRHILGWQDESGLHTREVYRFPNGMERENGHLIWDVNRLESEVRIGIQKAKKLGKIRSLAIDTWGVDYVLLRGDTPVTPCYAYRDDRTETVIPKVHEKALFSELYARTGIQYQPFNTIYQLCADQAAGRLEGVDGFLMLPEYLNWKLTGMKLHEYTNATTTGLVNAKTGSYDLELIQKLGMPEQLFGTLYQPGTKVGEYQGIPVVLCPSHDTASAVEGIPMEQEGLFLSSGTWSLLGAKLPEPVVTEAAQQANFTNEGGVGYIRFLRNIMGMWILQNLQKQLRYSYGEMAEMARACGEKRLFDVNAPEISAPKDMKAAILGLLGESDLTDGQLLASVHHSLASCYGTAVRELEEITGRSWDRLYIVGGGAKNEYLNELTAEYTGKRVIALPIEATALGNLHIQMEGFS